MYSSRLVSFREILGLDFIPPIVKNSSPFVILTVVVLYSLVMSNLTIEQLEEYTCQLFPSQMGEVFVLSCPEFPNNPDDFPKTSELRRKCSDDLFNDDVLVVVINLSAFFGLFSGISNSIFVINHVLKNNSSGFVSQA